jgi:hypothetical protein
MPRFSFGGAILAFQALPQTAPTEAKEISGGKRRVWIEVASTFFALALTYGLLLWYLKPSLLLSQTITAGGDTLSHYVAARYLRDYLLPSGKIVGWMPGNFAGYPIFLFYFPLTFLLIAGLSLLVPFTIAFKLGTVAGTFFLPLSTLVSLRWIGCPFPIPAIGAVLTLPFLLNTGNSMWGGNIPSTLAGEFAHSLSLALLVLFQGALYRGVKARRHVGTCAILLALAGFAHAYGLVMGVALGVYFLVVESDFRATFMYLARVYAIGGLLLGSWLVPLIAYLPYTTGFPITWDFKSALEIVPVMLWPTLAIAAVTVGLALWRKQADKEWLPWVHYLTYPVVVSVPLYFISPRLNLVDVRFVAFAQFFLTLLAAVGLGRFLTRLPRSLHLFAPPLLGIMTIAWIVPQPSFIPDWVRWNYAGIDRTPWWQHYFVVNKLLLAGGPNNPRVVYEHSPLHNNAGTIKAFEALPLFSGRSTLEGVYLQSSPSAPFIAYIQSELTETPSCPFRPYPCTKFNPERALAHLELFNVKQVIAVSDNVKAALAKNPSYREEGKIGPYTVFHVMPGNGWYVVPLPYEPAPVTDADWKRLAYEWFQKPEWLDVSLLFLRPGEPAPPATVPFRGLEDGPTREAFASDCRVKETLDYEALRFETDCPGRPHLIKISYHPKWRVQGADRIYLVSPAFMLVYPTAKVVRLVFGNRWPDYVGRTATAVGIIWLLTEIIGGQIRRRYRQPLPGTSAT